MRWFLVLLGIGVLIAAFLSLLPEQQKVTQTIIEKPALTTPLIRATDPRKGEVRAPVVLVEFGDFLCPACKEAQGVIAEVLARFPGKVLHIWKDFPLPIHPQAPLAHSAAQCASEQGKFWEYHDRLFALSPLIDGARLKTIAEELGLDLSRFAACQQNSDVRKHIAETIAEGQLLGVDQTPYLFINTVRLPGVVEKDTLIKMITSFITK